MPRTKEQYEQMRNATKEKIQEAAMQLFVQKGFGSTNVQDIADTAGISIGLLYRHYKSKDKLFNELVDFALAGMRHKIEYFQSDVAPQQALEQFVHEIYNDMMTGEQFANLLILMQQSFLAGGGATVNHDEVSRVSDHLFRATAMLIKKGQELGKFRSGDPHEMVLLFYSSIHGLAAMKMMLKNNFMMPSPATLTSFLYKEGE
ncbi:TetR/AcrR family transcriptional regulator [Paenibacillus sp. SC116]|uniref:TetR/AcrR family transcriptional regulator n=1 Tax=Paenibacillus sp. SC116 TaxID=2968986 RepID=UPI00215A73E1|nr:TetR/AcrR family transcriptional regulator [Paenibacillus sp. SC116]MCR8843612.1 TetR/AcrR family transcriptional regulator [Paenibacillus sp. SC116]